MNLARDRQMLKIQKIRQAIGAKGGTRPYGFARQILSPKSDVDQHRSSTAWVIPITEVSEVFR